MSDNVNGNGNGSRLHRVHAVWDTIPVDLKNRPLWLASRPVEIVTKSGEVKLDKKPLVAREPSRGGSSRDPSTWCSYDVCQDACEMFGLQPGLALGEGLLGADLDKCRDPDTGIIKDWAWTIIQELATYCEVSPSGTGVHMLMWADFGALATSLNLDPAELRKRTEFFDGKIEFYDRNSPHYFTVTGCRIVYTSE
jgi:primase-polymerase (primpol)-like protein